MKEKMIVNEYRHNKKFRRYVDKYSKHQGISIEEALKHEIVRQVYLEYKERTKNMDRLTIKFNGKWVPRDERLTQKCFDRLAAYEDIGLTPEQLREVDKLYAEKCKEVAELEKAAIARNKLKQIAVVMQRTIMRIGRQ